MINERLRKLEAEGRRIKVGLVGAGRFGTSVVSQISRMKGMEVSIIADVNPQNAFGAYEAYGAKKEDVCEVGTVRAACDAISGGKPVITADGMIVTESPVDVIVEATGVPNSGALIAYNSILNGKHVVMVNLEADALVGPILKRLADSAGVVYTIADGDQPGVVKGLYDWADALGFEIVAAGRGTKLYPGDRWGTPEDVFQRFGYSEDQVRRRRLNPRMYNSFRDGSKSQIEMASLANMTGLVPDVRGMHEPSASIEDLPNLFSLKEEGGILGGKGVVELANSIAEDGKTVLDHNIAIGVFVVITTDHPLLVEDMAFYGLCVGTGGKNGVLYRPYHLCGMETPMSIARAVIFNEATGAPIGESVADVITIAKRDLKAGEVLDGSGGFTVNGLIEQTEVARSENLLPLGLAYGVPVKRDVTKGEPITYDMVKLDESSFALKLRRLQDYTSRPRGFDHL